MGKKNFGFGKISLLINCEIPNIQNLEDYASLSCCIHVLSNQKIDKKLNLGSKYKTNQI